jgi:hypothetical protein
MRQYKQDQDIPNDIVRLHEEIEQPKEGSLGFLSCEERDVNAWGYPEVGDYEPPDEGEDDLNSSDVGVVLAHEIGTIVITHPS